MKKLMIAAFAAVLGLAANAAEFMWCAYNVAYDNAEYGSALTGTVYLFDGMQYTVDAIVPGLTDSLDKALSHQELDDGQFNLNGYGGLTGENQASVFVIVINEDEDGYWASEVKTATIDEEPVEFEFSYNIVSFTNIPEPTSNVPEPTSGLLLVLGMAGLALRRKRA